MNMAEAIKGKEAVVCLGSGGVGKTTVSAALALHCAKKGGKTVVCTIDPARRLADALGIEALGNEEKEVVSYRDTGGRLFAVMLDMKKTFDALIERYAPDEAVRDAILGNRYYQHLSNYLAGSHEYIAIEKFYELHQTSTYDCVVLDTPPTQRALDFLESPRRLGDLLQTTVFRWFFRPYLRMGRWGLRTLHKGLAPLFRIAERLTGVAVLQEALDFVLNFEGMFDGFMARSRRAMDLLTGPSSVFFLVLTPERVKVAEALYFAKKVVELRLPFGGFIVNRVRRVPEGVGEDVPSASELARAWNLSPSAGARLHEALSFFVRLSRAEGENILHLKERYPDIPVFSVPFLDVEVSSLDALEKIETSLFPAA